MSEPVSSRTKEPQAISRQKLQVAVGLLTGHTTLTAHMFKLGLTQRQECRLCGDEIRQCTYCVVLSGTGMQKIQNLVPCVLDAQGSRKHEVEWPNKFGSQYLSRRNTLTPY
jgi:hypothetical protein